MKRASLNLQEDDWKQLAHLAAQTGSLYSGQPSWRTLLKRIARGEIALQVAGPQSPRRKRKPTPLAPPTPPPVPPPSPVPPVPPPPVKAAAQAAQRLTGPERATRTTPPVPSAPAGRVTFELGFHPLLTPINKSGG